MCGTACVAYRHTGVGEPGRGTALVIGQLRSKLCPVCQGDNKGKWTCPSCTPLVDTHRSLIRNLQSWHSLYEAMEVPDILIASDRRSYCLWDVDLFYAQRSRLPDQQRIAIEYCLYRNVAEKVAAQMMGVSETSPVSIYATVGLSRLLGWAMQGQLGHYRLNLEGAIA